MVTLIIEDWLNNYIYPMQKRMKTLVTEMEWSLKTILNEKKHGVKQYGILQLHIRR